MLLPGTTVIILDGCVFNGSFQPRKCMSQMADRNEIRSWKGNARVGTGVRYR